MSLNIFVTDVLDPYSPGIGARPSQKKKRDGRVSCASRSRRLFIQAIHGLYEKASASCLARREHTRRLLPPQAAMLGANNGRDNQKPKRTATAKALVPSPLAGEG